jgi:hypothetical protein
MACLDGKLPRSLPPRSPLRYGRAHPAAPFRFDHSRRSATCRGLRAAWGNEELHRCHIKPSGKCEQSGERRVDVAGLHRLHVAHGHSGALCKGALSSAGFSSQLRHSAPERALLGRGVRALFHGPRMACREGLESALSLRYLLGLGGGRAWGRSSIRRTTPCVAEEPLLGRGRPRRTRHRRGATQAVAGTNDALPPG